MSRRAMLVLLDIHPCWWKRSDVWVLAAILLLAPVWATRPGTDVSTLATFSYVLTKGGSWTVMGEYHGDAPHFDFAASCRYQQGPGWRRWKVSPVTITGVNKPSAAPSQLDAARYVGYQFMLDTWATQGDAWMTTSLELLRDEHSGRWEGWFYLPRVVLMWAGSLLLTLALVAGFARLAMRNAYRARVEEVMGDVCPKCRYPRLGHNNEVCPECGLDFDLYVQEGLRELSRSRAQRP